MTRVFFIISIVLMIIFFSGCKVSDPLGEEMITSIKINNTTDFIFTRISIRKAGATDWVYNKINTYGPGLHIVNFKTYISASDRYEIELETKYHQTSNKLLATKYNLLFSENGTIDIEQMDFNDPEIANQITKINIFNDTGLNFSIIHIGISNSGTWSMYNLPGPFTNGTVCTLTNFDTPLNAQLLYDLQLVSTNGNIKATKRNQSLKHQGTVVYEQSDLD